MKPRPQGEAPPGESLSQGLRRDLPVPEGQHPHLLRPLEDLHPGNLHEPILCPAAEGALVLLDGIRPDLLHKADARQKPRDAGYVVGPGLQPVREEIRHVLLLRKAPGPPLQERDRRLALPAEKDSRPLGAQESLMPRHRCIGKGKTFTA